MTKKRRPKGSPDMLQRSITEMYQRMSLIADQIPEGADLAEDLEAQDHACNLWSIEEEWILDPDLREELSLLQCLDE